MKIMRVLVYLTIHFVQKGKISQSSEWKHHPPTLFNSYILVKIQCIVGASLSIIYETSHRVYILIAHKHISCTCHESNLQALR